MITTHNTQQREFLTVPPPQSVGGDGPNWEVVVKFLELLKLLSKNDQVSEAEKKRRAALLRELSAVHASSYAKSRKTAHKHVELHHIEEQLVEDPDMLKLLPVADVRALAEHHELETKDKTREAMLDELKPLYATKQSVAAADATQHKNKRSKQK